MVDVFISHAKADRKHLRRLAKALEAEGFDLWWEQNSAPDGKWTPGLQRALVDSAAILVCWSEESVGSQWVKAEASHGKDRNALIAITLGDCKIPAEFREIKAPDFARWKNDTDDPEWIAIVKRVRDLIEQKNNISAQAPPGAPPPLQPYAARPAPPPPPQQAQVVAPSAFFSANLGGGPAVARGGATPGRAAPLPQAPPQPQALRQPPPPPPRPEALQPARRPEAPRAFHPIESPPAPPQEPPAPAPRNLHPIDSPRPIRPVDDARPRPAPRAVRPVDEPPPRTFAREQESGARRPAPPMREPPPVRETSPPRRRSGGAGKAFLFLIAIGVLGGGGWWAFERFASAPSAPSLPEETASAPDPLPVDPAGETDLALGPPADELPPEIVEEEPETAAPATPPPAQPRVQPPAQPRTPPAAVEPEPAPPADATADARAAATRELERCLGRLVRLCPGSTAGVSRPGFVENGELSSAESALLRQRSLFDFSEVLETNVQNCQRHLNAASSAPPARPHEPLVAACRGLPTAGPPR